MPDARRGTRPLRVTVLSSLSRDSGGHLRAFYIAKHLARAGAEVRFLRSVRALPLFLDYFISALTHLRSVLLPCDVLIAQKPLFNVAVPLLVQRARGRVAIVDIDDDDAGFRAGPVGTINGILQRPLPRRCTVVTYHANALAARIGDVFRVPGHRLRKLPQGVDLEIFAPDAACAAARRERAAVRPVVVYPAHLNVASELEAVFRVFALARLSIPALRLVVVGGGPLEARCRGRARALGLDAVTTFTGHVRPQTVRDHLISASAGILYYEPRPANIYRESMKLREMLSLGLPVVCNDFGELPDFARWTYQAETSYEAVAAELVRLLATGGDGRERAGMAHVRGNLDWTVLGERLLATLVEDVAALNPHEWSAATAATTDPHVTIPSNRKVARHD